VDEVLREPLGGAHRDPQAMADALKTSILKHIDTLTAMSPEALLQARHDRIRGFGVYSGG